MRAPRIQYTTTRDNVHIAYAVSGEGAPVVFLQPNSHVQRDWEIPEMRSWYARLSEQVTLIRFDMRRFGLSERIERPITIDGLVAELEAVTSHIGLEQFDIVGVSGRGLGAMAYAARHPERVRRLVLWAASAVGADWLIGPRFRAVRYLADLEPTLAIEIYSRLLFGERPVLTPEQFEHAVETFRASDIAAFLDLFAETDLTGLLPRIACPTLVVFPRHHDYITVEAIQRVAAAIPNAEFVYCDGQVFPWRSPNSDQNLELITSFLAVTDLRTALDVLGHASAAEARGDVPEALHYLDEAITLLQECDGTFYIEQAEAMRRRLLAADERAHDADRAGISPREIEVIRLVARGLSNREIADELVISSHTVARHIANIHTKIGGHNRADVTRYAIRHGLL